MTQEVQGIVGTEVPIWVQLLSWVCSITAELSLLCPAYHWVTETKAGKMLLGHFSETERLDSEWKSVSFPMSHPLKAIGSPECSLSRYPESGHFDPCLGEGTGWLGFRDRRVIFQVYLFVLYTWQMQ